MGQSDLSRRAGRGGRCYCVAWGRNWQAQLSWRMHARGALELAEFSTYPACHWPESIEFCLAVTRELSLLPMPWCLLNSVLPLSCPCVEKIVGRLK